MSMDRKVEGTVLALIVAALVAATLAANVVPRLPDRDAGVFLYAGQRILQGDVPYRDFWDHKGPAIFYINALGLVLGRGTEMGVWLLEALALVLAGVLGYAVMRREFGPRPALLATALWMATASYTIRPGNYTEEFGLPLQFAGLWFFSNAESGKRSRWSFLGVGATLAGLVLLRPNNGSVPLAILTVLVLEALVRGSRAKRLADAGMLLAGAIVPLGGTALYFASQGALGDMLDAVLVYNTVYTRASLFARIDAITEGLRLLAPSGLGILGILGWGRVTLRWLPGSGADRPSAIERAAAIALALELVMVAAAGRSLNHYFATWLPSLAILACGLISDLLEILGNVGSRLWVRQTAWAAILFATCLVPLRDLTGQVRGLLASGPRGAEASAEAREITAIGGVPKTLLMWGAETTFNFLLAIPAPTRYVYQYPLYMCGYTTPARVAELADAIRQSSPLIVDTSSTNGLVPPIDAAERERWAPTSEGCSLTEAMQALLTEIDSAYELKGTMPSTGWAVYGPRNPLPGP